MSHWPSTRARKVLRALLKIGWSIKSQRGSHTQLVHPQRGEFTWAFHDSEEIGPSRVMKKALEDVILSEAKNLCHFFSMQCGDASPAAAGSA